MDKTTDKLLKTIASWGAIKLILDTDIEKIEVGSLIGKEETAPVNALAYIDAIIKEYAEYVSLEECLPTNVAKLAWIFNEVIDHEIYYIEEGKIISDKVTGIGIASTHNNNSDIDDSEDLCKTCMLKTESSCEISVDDYEITWFLSMKEAEEAISTVTL